MVSPAARKAPKAVRVGQVTAVAWPGQLRACASRSPVEQTGPRVARSRLAAPRSAPAHRRARRAATRLSHPRTGARVGRRRSRMPGSRTIAPAGRSGRASTNSPPRAGPPGPAPGGAGPRSALVRRGLRRWAAGEWERLGPARPEPRRGRGARVPDLAASTARCAGRSHGRRGLRPRSLGRDRAGPEEPDRYPGAAHGAAGSRARSFDEAVLATTGLTMDQFDEAWHQGLRRRYSLGTWLLAGGGWLVVAAIVAWSCPFSATGRPGPARGPGCRLGGGPRSYGWA